MALKLSVVLSKKIGQPDYGSLGASCGVEFEIDLAAPHSDPKRLQAQVRDAFAACQQAVDNELERLSSSNGKHAEAQPSRDSAPIEQQASRSHSSTEQRTRRLATPAQLQALALLAQRQGLNLDRYVASHSAVATADQLSLVQASRLIGSLRSMSKAS